MSLARNGNSRLRWKLSARWPWNSPQSSKMIFPFALSWCIDPVTVRVAPQNVTVGSGEEDGLGTETPRVDDSLRESPVLKTKVGDSLRESPVLIFSDRGEELVTRGASDLLCRHLV